MHSNKYKNIFKVYLKNAGKSERAKDTIDKINTQMIKWGKHDNCKFHWNYPFQIKLNKLYISSPYQ